MKLLVLITLLSLSSLKVFADEAATPKYLVILSKDKIIGIGKVIRRSHQVQYAQVLNAQEVDYITVNNKNNGDATIKSTIPNSLEGAETQAAISKILYGLNKRTVNSSEKNLSSWDCKITNAEVKSESITTTFYCKFHA